MAEPQSQATFWTEDWQSGEREVDNLVAMGYLENFSDAESLLAALSELAEGGDGDGQQDAERSQQP